LKNELERIFEGICLRIWEATYKKTERDVDAMRVSGLVSEQVTGVPEDNDLNKSSWMMKYLFGAKWLHCGRVQLVTTHKYAAALMSTDIKESLTEDMVLPWKAFVVHIPDGLLLDTVSGIQFNRIEVASFDGLPFVGCINLRGERRGNGGECSIGRVCFTNLEDLFFKFGGEEFLGSPEIGRSPSGRLSDPRRDIDVKERSIRLATRLVTGLLYTMQHTNNFRPVGKHKHRDGNKRDGPPPHRVYFVGSPIGVDCRTDVQRYLSGSVKSPPTVQTLVRGHFKRQVVGIGRSGRKVIWVEPYWRGPEEAPILSRPYSVK
jgi:hypothetical protein